MFFPSGDHNSPSASVAMDVSLCFAVTVPVVPSKSAIQICDPLSLVETNANCFPSGAHRGRSASWSEMISLSLLSVIPTEAGCEASGEAEEPAFDPFSGTTHTWGVLVLAFRSTSTAANSTHFPSGETSGSSTRLSAIMSSNVNGCFP